MRAYTVIGANASGNATKTAVTVIASNAVRPAIHGFSIGNGEAPSDLAITMALRRFTAAGTAGGAVTPVAVDSSDLAAVATAGEGHSAEPTYSATLLSIPMNKRLTFRYVSTPGFEFKAPATNANGIGLQVLAAGGSVIQSCVQEFFE